MENPEAHQDSTPDESRSKSMKSELNLVGSLQQSQLQAQASVLKNGSRGPEVEKLQDSLIASGYMTADQKATGPGVFGPQTEAALKAFQKDHGLNSDGVFGPESQKAMGGEPRGAEKLQEEKEKKPTPSKLESRADAIRKACEGLGTDEQALFKNLQGLTNQERKELDRIYQQKYGISLEQEIRGELSGKDLDKALALLKGGSSSPLENRADAIRRACEGLGTDEQALFKNLQGLTSQERKELDRIYQQKYGVSLEQEIRGELSGDDLDKALGLLKGETPSRPQNREEPLETEHRSRRNREIE